MLSVLCDEIVVKYNSYETVPLETTLQEDMAVIYQSPGNGVSMNLKYAMKPILIFRASNL